MSVLCNLNIYFWSFPCLPISSSPVSAKHKGGCNSEILSIHHSTSSSDNLSPRSPITFDNSKHVINLKKVESFQTESYFSKVYPSSFLSKTLKTFNILSELLSLIAIILRNSSNSMVPFLSSSTSSTISFNSLSDGLSPSLLNTVPSSWKDQLKMKSDLIYKSTENGKSRNHLNL